MPIFLSVLLLFALIGPVNAATMEETSFKTVTLTAPYPWTAGLQILFNMDEDRCKNQYGKRWRTKCAAPMGRPGEMASVPMTPRTPGHWQWETPHKLVFVPRDGASIRPDTVYTVDTSQLPRPMSTVLDKTQLNCKTLPFAAKLGDMRFMVDPSTKAQHRLTLALEFNYPVPGHIFFPKLDLPQGVRSSKPEIVWNSLRDRVNIAWVLDKLPAKTGLAKVSIPQFGSLVQTEDELRFQSHASFSHNLPGTDELFQVSDMRISTDLDAQLNSRQVLQFNTSLHVAADQVVPYLHVVELPQFNGPQATIPYDWSAAPYIPTAIASRAKVLKPTPLQSGKVLGSSFRFTVPATPGSYVLVRVADGLRSASGMKLAKATHAVLQAPALEGRVGFLQSGHILPGNSRLALYANDIDTLQWQIQRVRDPFWALLAQASANIFTEPFSSTYLPITSFSESLAGEIKLLGGKAGQPHFPVLPVTDLLTQNNMPASALVNVVLTGLKNGKEVAKSSKMLLISDLNLLLKRTKRGKLHCFTNSLISGQPVDAKIDILGANGTVVVSTHTDHGGHTLLPSLTGFTAETRPVAAIASRGDALAFLPLADTSRELDFAQFDTGGSHVDADGLVAFVFSQRGIYRPGETLHFGVLPRKGDFSLLPSALPLMAELCDPRGVRIYEEKLTPGNVGIAELAWSSATDSLSGKYTLNVRTSRDGDVIGSCAVRLENFLPDTLKIQVNPPAVKGWLIADSLVPTQMQIKLQNLYGTPAQGHQIKATVLTSPAQFRFPGYEDWIFTDPSPFLGAGQRQELPQTKTDANGHATLALPPELMRQASARVTVLAEGFDAASARSASGSASLLVSPLLQILGYKFTGSLTNNQFIPRGSEAKLQVRAIDARLEPVAWNGVQCIITNRNYLRSLISDGQGGYRYDETYQDLPVKSWTEQIPQAGTVLTLPTQQVGDFLFQIRDREGHILLSLPYNVVGNSLTTDATKPSASKMRLRLDKAAYNSGEEIQLAVTVPYEAHGLISLERDDVYAHKWIHCQPGENLAKIRIPEAFQGKGHVVVSMSRAEKSPIVHMSPLAYATAPFTANVTKRQLPLKLTAPDVARPGQTLQIQLTAPKVGKAIIYAVDEGVLQLTNYQTPRPLQRLLEDRALDLATIQTADLLMPREAIIAARIAAFGGGADGGVFGSRFQNPFKRKLEPPLISWSGIVNVGPAAVSLDIPVPSWYAGNIRIMVVGASEDAVGSTSVQTLVTAPMVLTPVLPLAVAPGDCFEGALIVANTTDAPIAGKLRTKLDSALQFRNEPPEYITLTPGEERSLPFTIEAGSEPSAAQLTFTVETDGGIFARSAFLSLRPGSALRTTIQSGVTSESGALPRSRSVYAYGANSEIMTAQIPLPLAASLGKYLDTYPHGCTEQLTSRAFAHALLMRWPAMQRSTEEINFSENREKLLKATINAIASRFQEGQGVSLWSQGEADLLTTAYVVDYLLTAREQGLGDYDNLLENLCNALAWNCAMTEPTLKSARASAYAIWVLAREGRVVTQLLENLQEELAERGVPGWREDITAVLMTAAMREMRMPTRRLWTDLHFMDAALFSQLAQIALTIYVEARYFPDELSQRHKEEFYSYLTAALNDNAYGTFAAAQAVRAIVTLAGRGAPVMMAAELRCPGKKLEQWSNGSFLGASIAQCPQYDLKLPSADRTVYWQISTTGYDTEFSAVGHNSGIEIDRQFLNAACQPVTQVKQGDELTVRIRMRSARTLPNCVVSDLLPGGLELIIPRDSDEQVHGVKMVDRQEDRLLLFVDLEREPLEFSYKARAVTPGTFQIPPIAAESMSDGSCSGSGPIGTMIVSRADSN